MTKEVLTVQYLRGIAAAIVVLHHILSTNGLGYLYQDRLGDLGVDIFFVISGFIMWHTTVETGITTFEFWRRRVTRIVPLYWMFLALLVTVALLLPHDMRSTTIRLDNTLKSFFFIPHNNLNIHMIAPILIPGWSLNYEMFFYFVFGLILFLPARQFRAAVLLGLLSGLVAAGYIFRPTNPISETYTNPELLKFAGGLVLALAYRANILTNPKLALVLLIGFALCILVYGGAPSPLGAAIDFAALSPILIVGGSLALETRAQKAPIPVLETIGNASYSIYLSHLFFLRIAELIWRRFADIGSNAVSDAFYVPAAFMFAILGGVAVYYIIERRLIRTFRRPRGNPSKEQLSELSVSAPVREVI